MRWTQLLIPTLKEDPADAEAVSHRLMVRAGYVRQLAAGIYVYLPLGQRVMDRVTAIVREEMNRIGGQEITMPILHPAEIWQQTGRWDAIGGEMFRLKDRGGRDMCLAMTHEEVVAWLAAHEIRSYRELPQVWYQIQTKERDEARPKSGVLRTREFLMKDSYSLDRDEAGLDAAYERHRQAYTRIFARCGLKIHVVESDVGMMGGAGAHEFMAPSPAGEDSVALCPACGYAANTELARSRPAPQPDGGDAVPFGEVATPGARTIDEVCACLKVPPALTIKALMVMGPDGPAVALVRGDQHLHEKKLAHLIGPFRPAHREEVRQHAGVEAGFLGPVGLRLPMMADVCLESGRYVCGANTADAHLRGVVPGTDFAARFVDIHEVVPGDGCPRCGAPLRVDQVIEVGNIFKLGTKYSKSMGAVYLDEKGEEHPIVMGSYGIGPARIAAAAIEQGHDADGIIWPPAIAPFDVHLLPVNPKDAAMAAMADAAERALAGAGLAVLHDDREDRPGVKFKDADLLGVPVRITVGSRAVKEGVLEVRCRRTKAEVRVPPDGLVEAVRQMREAAAA